MEKKLYTVWDDTITNNGSASLYWMCERSIKDCLRFAKDFNDSDIAYISFYTDNEVFQRLLEARFPRTDKDSIKYLIEVIYTQYKKDIVAVYNYDKLQGIK